MPGLLDATVDVRGQRIRVLDTHLDYRGDPAVRTRQVAEMVRYVNASPLPTVVFGDLNAPPDAAELRPLLERLHDAWPRDAGGGFTYPANAPVKRIDYVLASDHFRIRSAAVIETLASDHRPVVVELVLR
jgi:endonuclease/exonuclease/phosphatase family metal-dependent hydrolase